MFPSSKIDGHVSQSALNLLFLRLQGQRWEKKPRAKANRPGKPGPKPGARPRAGEDLFAKHGIRPWTPHDVRRTITGFLDDRRLGSAASAILGHRNQDESTAEKERMQKVTQLHYLHSQRIPLKTEGVEEWVQAVLDQYHKEKATSEAGLPASHVSRGRGRDSRATAQEPEESGHSAAG